MLVANLGQPNHPFTLSQSKKHSYSKATGNNGTSTVSSKNSQLLIPTTNSLCTTQPSIDSDNVFQSLSVRITRDDENCQPSLQPSLIAKIPTANLNLNLNLNTVPPTPAHRKPELLYNRADSIRSEMCHFKPIRTVPTTPPRRYCSNMVRLPKVKKAEKLNCDVKISSKRCSAVLRAILSSQSHKSAFCYMGKITRKSSFLRSHNTKKSNSTSTSTTSTNTPSSSARSSTHKEYPIIVSSDDEFYPNTNDLENSEEPVAPKKKFKEAALKETKKAQPKRKKPKTSITPLTKRKQGIDKSSNKLKCLSKMVGISKRNARLSSNTSVDNRTSSKLFRKIKDSNQTTLKKMTHQNKGALNKSKTINKNRLLTFSPRITRSARLKGISIPLYDGSQIANNKRSKKN